MNLVSCSKFRANALRFSRDEKAKITFKVRSHILVADERLDVKMLSVLSRDRWGVSVLLEECKTIPDMLFDVQSYLQPRCV